MTVAVKFIDHKLRTKKMRFLKQTKLILTKGPLKTYTTSFSSQLTRFL